MTTLTTNACLPEKRDCERLFSLGVLGVEDRGDTNNEILNEFKENIVRKDDGRYKITFPWISGRTPTDTNEQQSRKWLQYVYRKLDKAPELKREYDNIVKEQLSAGMVEEAPDNPTGERIYYMPHKPVDCMYMGPLYNRIFGTYWYEHG